MENRQLGKLFENDWSEDELEEIYEDITTAVTIPVNVAIKGEHKVLDLSKVMSLLKDADLIAISDCGCRRDRKNCDAPVDVCISLDEEAKAMLKDRRYNSRIATLQEAIDALRRSHEAGLVHMAYVMKGDDQPTVICSCCSCCCHTLSGLIRFGIAKHIVTADLISETDFTLCANCGACIERCQFGARKMIDGRLTYNSEQCFGCGLCVSTCPQGAIKLGERDLNEHV